MKVTATHELGQQCEEHIMVEEKMQINHNNQGNKEETEPTKNSAIPLVLPRFSKGRRRR